MEEYIDGEEITVALLGNEECREGLSDRETCHDHEGC
ncbi:hypothetical protein [Mesorhizobium sp.]|nr:hypothetical protein [Mesorhizobium sp.]